MKTFQKNFLFPLRDLLYPPLCFICDSLLDEDADRICRKCRNSFITVDSRHATWREIREKFSAEGVVSDFVSCFLFEKEGRLQDVVHQLKYSGMKSFGVELGREIGHVILSHPALARAELLVPIPLHRLKQRERGYNQSEFLCRGIMEVTGTPIASNLLLRKKYTQSQTQLDIRQRKENVGDAFQRNPRAKFDPRGKTCILVDDVITTGSTVNACARELLLAGAETVFAASAALAQ